MANLAEKISQSTAAYPATAVVRNYMASSNLYSTRYIEFYCRGAYNISLQVYPFEGSQKHLFSISYSGKKNETIELCYLSLARWVDQQLVFRTQGLDEGNIESPVLSVDDSNTADSKEQNVIITGAEDSIEAGNEIENPEQLLKWSSTEPFYRFDEGTSGLMGRWFPLDTTTITTTDSPVINGGLIKNWLLPEDLYKDKFDDINVLPVRGFLLGKYNLEIKVTSQANPFQACCFMVSLIPYPFGLIPNYKCVKGLMSNQPANFPFSAMTGKELSYMDFQCAVQRPHLMFDVSNGGEGVLVVSQKYHKTLIRNFDFGFVSTVNPGLRGSVMAGVALHVVSPLVVGTGNENRFNVRLFYRFVDTKLTAMSSVVSQTPPTKLSRQMNLTSKQIRDGHGLLQRAKNSEEHRNALRRIWGWETQGIAMSALSAGAGAIHSADKIVTAVENFGGTNRKGFRVTNRDKPKDISSQVRVNPRPRMNFPNGEGLDDPLVMAVNWTEMVQFFEVFQDEPKSFKDFVSLTGLLGRFSWSITDTPATGPLFTWNIHPSIAPDRMFSTFDGNVLRSPLNIASSCFTNYWGTMELYFQFVKTQYHKGSVEVAIHFARQIQSSGLKSSYVKILNVQECSGFSVTIPYIYDTPVRSITGTSTPFFIPSVTNPTTYAFAHSAQIAVSVINDLVAPSSVGNSIEVLVWIKGGRDFGMNFPRAVNTATFSPNFTDTLLRNPSGARTILSSPNPQNQEAFDMTNATISTLATLANANVYPKNLKKKKNQPYFQTQGLESDEDFNQGSYDGNRITDVEHMNFKTMLKMPIKILSFFEYVPKVNETVIIDETDVAFQWKRYISIPVAPINSSLINYLNWEYFNARSTAPDMPGNPTIGSVYGNTVLQQSVPYMINSMFGLCRGTFVYTIVNHGTTPLYIQYLPHDYRLRNISGPLSDELIQGTVGIDSFNIGGGVIGMQNDNHVDLAMCAPYNTFIIPSVNQSEKIEVPMSTQNNWILMNRMQAGEGMNGKTLTTMRENSEWFNGHIVLWSEAETQFSVYLNMGDDVELGGFLGHVGLSNPWSGFSQVDNWRAQGLSDFRFKELTHLGWSSLQKAALHFTAGGGLMALHNYVPSPLSDILGAMTIYTAVAGASQVVKLKRYIDQGVSQVENVQNVVDELSNVGTQFIMGVLHELFPFVERLSDVKQSLWTIAQHLVHSALAQKWSNCAFSLFCILTETRLFTLDDWKLLKDHLVSLLVSVVPGQFQTQGENAWESLMEIMVAVITTKLQIKSTGGFAHYLKEMFMWQNYKNVTGLNSILVLTRTFMRAISKVITWAFEEADPNISLLKALQKQDSDLAIFLEEATMYLSNFNDNDFKRKDLRIKYLHTILRAMKLRLVLLKIANPKLTGQLLQICNKVIDKANKQRYLFKCDIVKSEPYVLCIAGKANVGKSFSVYDLASHLMKAIKYKTDNPDIIYTIPSGVQYWNGYADQPVVMYDDWCNLSDEETMRNHISQLYALKTSAQFNVPRAELENKEQIACPELIVLATNNPFPKSSILVDSTAVYRRRDLLVEFSIVGGKAIGEFTEAELHSYKHIQVKIYKDPVDQGSCGAQLYSYDDFKNLLTKKFISFHEQELKNKNFKYETLNRCSRKINVDSINLGNPFELIEQIEFENCDLTTTQKLDIQVEELLQQINNLVTMGVLRVENEELYEAQGLNEIGQVVLQRCSDLKDKFREWTKVYRRKFIRCENCNMSAEVHGTTFWCPTGSHYMCFHCAMICGIARHKLDNNNEVYVASPICPEHNQCMELRQESFLKGILAEIIASKVDIPIKFYHFVKGMSGSAPHPIKFMYALVEFIKLYLAMYTGFVYKSIFNTGYMTQGVEELSVHPENYDAADLVESEIQKSDLWDKYKSQISSSSNRTFRYHCQHSFLIHEHTYSNGEYFVQFEEEDGSVEDIAIPDKVCRGKCVLLNKNFLETIRNVFEVHDVSGLIHDPKQVNTLKFYLPKYLLPPNVLHVKKRLENLKGIFKLDWWDTYVSPLGEAFMKTVRFVVPLLLACTVLWGTYRVVDLTWSWLAKFFGFSVDVQGSMVNESGEKQAKRNFRKRGKFNAYNTQSNVNLNLDNKLNKIASNYVILHVGGSHITAWGIKGSTMLVPKHLATIIEKHKIITLEFVAKEHERIEILRENLVINHFVNRDLTMITVEKSKILFKDCSSFLPPKTSEITNITKGTVLEVRPKESLVGDIDVNIIGPVRNTSAVDNSGVAYLNDIGIMYDYENSGLCGSILCVDSINPIVSMHISGSSNLNRGIGVLLYREEFEAQGSVEIEDTEEETTYYGRDCCINYEASISRDLIPFVPNKTGIVPSLIHDVVPHQAKTIPAILSRDHELYTHDHSPLYYGVLKNGKPTLDFPKFYLNKAYEGLKHRFLSGNLIKKPQIYTVEQAITGFPKLKVEDEFNFDCDDNLYYGCLALDTSVGWPYDTNLYKKKYGIASNSKSAWVKVEYSDDGLPEKVEIHSKILEDHEINMNNRKQGNMSLNIFQDCLKDERRPILKALEQGGTRLFSMSNIEGTIALRRYTLDLTNHLRYNRLNNGFSVGINPESFEWTILAQKLLSKGNNIFTTDFTNFGAGLNFYCGMQFSQLIIDFFELFCPRYLSSDDHMIIEVLIRELMSSRHVVGNLIYSTYSGSPSGAAITVEINSFVHLLYILISWYIVGDVFSLMSKGSNVHNRNLLLGYNDLKEYIMDNDLVEVYESNNLSFTTEDFLDNLITCVYGDDGIFSITDKYRECFNSVIINLVLKEHRIGVTDASKSGKIMKYGVLAQSTFLKRTFVDSEIFPSMGFSAALSWVSVEECARWIHNKPLEPELATYENAKSSLMLSWGHGRLLFDSWKLKLNSALLSKGLRVLTLTWEEVAAIQFPNINFSYN